MKLRRIAGVAPKPDLSNLNDLTLIQINTLPNRSAVIERMKMEILRIAQEGAGINFDSIPAPHRQTGIECQTYAVLNGSRVVAPDIGGIIDANPAEIVSRARTRTESLGLKSLDMSDVALSLPEQGVPIRDITKSDNPLVTTKALFAPRRFLGVSDNNTWHATSIVPLENPTEERFVARLDSLSSGLTTLSLSDFIDLLISKDPFKDKHIVYEVDKA